MPYKTEDLAYIAGLIDGEGYIGLVKYIEKRRTKNIKNRITYYYHPVVKLAMCDRDGIDLIDSLFLGNIWFHQRNEKYKNWKNQWEWQAKGQKRVKEILQAILPYLKVKRKQAELVIDFIRNREIKETHKIKWGQTSYDKNDNEIYNKSRLLNHKGVSQYVPL